MSHGPLLDRDAKRGPIAAARPRVYHRLLHVMAILVFACSSARASAPVEHAAQGIAAGQQWQAKPYSYVAVDQDLRDVLREFAGNVGVSLNISDRVTGTVRARWIGVSAGEFLDRVVLAYGLAWYFDGYTLFVTNASESMSKLVALHEASLATLADSLARSGLADPRFSLRQGPAAGTVLVSGPPRYVQVVEQSVDALNAKTAPPQGHAAPVLARTLLILRGGASSRMTFSE